VEDDKDQPIAPPSLTSKQQGFAALENGASLPILGNSLSKVNSEAFARLKEKLHLLNLKYELISPANESSCQPPRDPELIPHGDVLRLNACRARDKVSQDFGNDGSEAEAESKFTEVRSFEVRPIENPRIKDAWKQDNENEVMGWL
jgi:hypothetical protein